jgi:hypothetical protein
MNLIPDCRNSIASRVVGFIFSSIGATNDRSVCLLLKRKKCDKNPVRRCWGHKKMARFSRFLITSLCIGWLMLAFERPAHALYADPGSGLLALQVLGSTLAGVTFYFRQKMSKFFSHHRLTTKKTTGQKNRDEDSIHPPTE